MISVHDLTFSYPGTQEPALTSVNFELSEGEIFGFLGPSGAGKSTTQKILIGLLRDYAGQVHVMGKDLKDWAEDYYESVGVAFEFPNHYLKLTAKENLDYFRSLYSGPTADPMNLLKRVALEGDAHKRVGQFSKGMQVRLSIARALINQPKLLFLDEPTAGLDPVTSRLVRQLISEVRDTGATVFLTTHNMELADELCDRVAFLVGGEIALIDEPRRLKLEHGRRTVRIETVTNGAMSASEFPIAGLADNSDFLTLLRSASVETIHTQETTLEEVFVQLTGQKLQ